MIAEHPSIKEDLDCIIKKPITTAKLLERLEMHLK
jgi:hypothetical protein